MKLKRQINIKNSELIDVVDTNLISNDDLLKPYLNINAENKMKTIIASIQKEQNNIIRRPISENIIVQGVAGSGKTSVALHRIACLIYNLGDKIRSNQFLVLGPNNYFLNYISSILPELETDPVEQKTLINLLNEYADEKLSLIENEIINDKEYENISKFKSSLEYKSLLDIFMKNYLNNAKTNIDFKIDDQIVFSKEEIDERLYSDKNKFPDYDAICKYFIEVLKENIENIYNRLNEKYKNIYINLPMDDPIREEAVTKSNELSKLLKINGSKLLKDYFKKLKIKVSDVYKTFIINLNTNNTLLTEKEILLLQKSTLTSLNRKKIYFEDIAALIHINYLLKNKKTNYKHVIIDEAQDYGLFHFDAIKEITEPSTFSIYGDLAQSIYSYRSIDSWNEVIEKIFNNDCELLNLSKSYRTTIEITNNANQILEQLKLNLSNPVIRHGDDVEYYDTNNIESKINILSNLKQSGYKTIAVICKTEKEAKNMYKTLIDNGIDIKYISSKDETYEGGICILTSAASKGLEFDAVLINDASNNVYLTNSNYDMHLLYVACTRALHKLVILYNKKLCNVFNNENIVREKSLIKNRVQ